LDIRRRFTIALRRALAAQIGVPTRQLCRLLRLSFAKVAEMQQRAAVHYHAVIRLDRPDDGWQPPHFDVTADQLEAAIRTAATKVHLNAPEIGRQLRWGDQVDVQPISRHTENSTASSPPRKWPSTSASTWSNPGPTSSGSTGP
jgi:hypothetical protein